MKFVVSKALMRSWLKRAGGSNNSSRASSSSRNNHKDGSISPWRPMEADPGTWLEAFESHWNQANNLITSHPNGPTTIELSVTVANHFDQMILLLLTETNSQPLDAPAIGPLLDILFNEQMLDIVVDWVQLSQASRDNLPSVSSLQATLLKLYEGMVTQSHHCLLVHKPILLPLLRLFDELAMKSDILTLNVQRHFVLLLNQICTKMSENQSLVEFFFTGTNESRRFVVFTMLIPYLYDEGDIGQLARDAVLLVLTVSSSNDAVALFLADQTNLCPVLASGLSGCYSQLPRQVIQSLSASDDWHSITLQCLESLPALNAFYGALLFSNAVLQVGHRRVREKLLDFVYNGFLASVVAPSLFETGLDELVSCTAYLDLMLRTVTEPTVLKLFIRFIITHEVDNQRIVDVLVQRLSSNSTLALVSFSLFHTLLGLYCEDLMLELVLKYLLPCTHVMPSQVSSITNVDTKGVDANNLLQLAPKCSLNSTSNNQTLASYLSEYGPRIANAREKCKGWAYVYDAQTPDPFTFRSNSPQVSDGAETDNTTASSNFSRASSLRRSRPNSYFTNKHPSCKTNALSAIDLAVLGPEEFDNVHDDLDSPHNNTPPSVSSTPRWAKRDQSTNYFKLAFEDDCMSIRDSQGEESDAAGFVLRGWSDIQDSGTFGEVLNRVRVSHRTPSDVEQNMKFLDDLADRIIVNKKPKLNDLLENEEESEFEGSEMSRGGEQNGFSCDEDMLQSLAQFQPPAVVIKCPVNGESPTLGPFLENMIDKLAHFTTNTLWMNLQVTGLLCQLAIYPQPLINSALLNTRLIFQPNVPTVFQVLKSAQQKIDLYAVNITNFGSMVERGKKWLMQRERKYVNKRDKKEYREDRLVAPVGESMSLSNSSSIETLDGKPRSSSDINPVIIMVERNDRARAISFDTNLQTHTKHKFHHKKMQSAEVSFEALRTKNMVYWSILLNELVHELAAISLEHSANNNYSFPFEYKM